MDLITTAIVAALASGIVSGTTKFGEQVILDAYNQLKVLLKKKLGAKSKVVIAVKDLEARPQSEARKAVLREEVTGAGADKDADLVKAAQVLLKEIKALPGGDQIVQMAVGNQNVQIAGNGNAVNVNPSKPKR
jgi:hypothetical protein